MKLQLNPAFVLHFERRGTKVFWEVLRKKNNRELVYLRCPGSGIPRAEFELGALRAKVRTLLRSAAVEPKLKTDDYVQEAVTGGQ